VLGGVAGVVGVLGGSGGVGASTLAAALATSAGRSVLVDCDPVGGGIDVLLGIEAEPGARWSGLQVGGGQLDPQLLDEGLPRWGEVGVIAADVAPPADAIEQVVAAAAALGPVVLDLPREPGPLRSVTVSCCRLCVLLATSRVATLAAARATMPEETALGVVLRRGPGADTVPAVDAARMLGVPLLGGLPPMDGSDLGARIPRVMLRVAAGILDGLDAEAAS
jgi:NAD(P)-dependent dehydrogenase (short-subunit alcohol dehydrogenase family)